MIDIDTLNSIPLRESPGSRRGVEYEVANGQKIPNLGEKRFMATTEDGQVRALKAQVCEVNRPLLSVKKAVAAGNTVVFDEGGSYIMNKKSQQKMWLKEENGVHVLQVMVAPPTELDKHKQDFTRQGD